MSAALSPTHQGDVYYKDSRAISCAGLIYMVIVGTVVTLILSIIYGYVTSLVRSIYLAFFIAFFYGWIVGYVVGFAGKLGKVRKRGVLLLFGFIFGTLAEYAGWVSWISAVLEEVDMLTLFFSPGIILSVITIGAVEGVWSIFDWTPTGLTLYIIWGIEAIIVIGTATLVAGRALVAEPFCKYCNRWVKQTQSVFRLEPVTNPDQLKTQLEHGDYTSLDTLKKVETGSTNYTKLELLQCPTCQQFRLLTVKSVNINSNFRGNVETKENEIVENLLLDSKTYDTIRATMVGKRNTKP